MKTLLTTAIVLGLSCAALPAIAQNSVSGNGPVAGEGPGGSGANQSSLGPSKAFLSHHHYRYHIRHWR